MIGQAPRMPGWRQVSGAKFIPVVRALAHREQPLNNGMQSDIEGLGSDFCCTV